MDRAVAARDEQAVRIYLAHKRDEGLIALLARAVKDDEDASFFKMRSPYLFRNDILTI